MSWKLASDYPQIKPLFLPQGAQSKEQENTMTVWLEYFTRKMTQLRINSLMEQGLIGMEFWIKSQ